LATIVIITLPLVNAYGLFKEYQKGEHKTLFDDSVKNGVKI
jgi:hypothetical protein